MDRYFASPGNTRFSPESVSVIAYGTAPGALGDYSASTHLQGELLGAMLDLIVRDATNGALSIDDVMRTMLERFSGERGFGGRDREQAGAHGGGWTGRSVFGGPLRGAKPIGFVADPRPIGQRPPLCWPPAVDGGAR